MGKRGPRPKATIEELYWLAEDLYRDFRRLREGTVLWRFDERRVQEFREGVHATLREHSLDLDEVQTNEVEMHSNDRDEPMNEIEEAAVQAGIVSWKVDDPDVLDSLLNARTAGDLRDICKDAYVNRQDLDGRRIQNWPLRADSALPYYLDKYAERFVAAKRDPRFPGKNRPSSELKRLWFLSRALAGARFGLEIRTAVNMIGATRPEEILVRARAGKRQRRKKH